MRVGDKCIVVGDTFNNRIAVIVKVFQPANGYNYQYGIQVERYDYGPSDRRSREETGQASNWHRATTSYPSGPYLCIKPYKKEKSGLTKFMEKHYAIPC